MRRVLFFLYGIIAYLAFFGSVLYAIAFIGNLFVSKSIDGNPQMPTVPALLIDVFLILLFAVQHSVMARPAFKRWWTKFIPEPIERSTYVLLASLCLVLLMWQWQPIGGVIWEITDATATTIILIVYFIGWTVFFLSTLGTHLDLFGLKQSWLYFRNKPYAGESFKIPFLYKLVRHPMYLGFLLAFWAAPTMTVTHLFFTLLTTLYILTAIQMEERDLIVIYGESYVEYRNTVPMILPFSKRRRETFPINKRRSEKEEQFEKRSPSFSTVNRDN